jgi:hypothetical protein
MLFALDGLFDKQACYDFLLKTLYPNGLQCPKGHALPFNQAPHDRHREPMFDYRCRVCGRVYNLYSGTIWQKTRYRRSVIVQATASIIYSN